MTIDKNRVIFAICLSLAAMILYNFLLQPLFGVTRLIINKLSNSFTIWFTNLIIYRASFGYTDEVGNLFLSLLAGAFTGISVNAVLRLFDFRRPSMATEDEKKKRRRAKILNILFIILLISTILITLLLHLYDYQRNSSSTLIKSFNFRITVLAPSLTEQEEEELRAKWSLMSNKKDYIDINNQFEEYAKRGNIKLPKPVWP